MKVLSIIVPSFNMELYLDRCLSSLILPENMMDSLEVIVVNDGSTDRTSEIAHGFADRYPQSFIVIDKSNGHYGSCVNAGLKIASGKYVKVLDADDWFETEEFCQYVQNMAKVDVDVVFSRYAVLAEGKRWESPIFMLPDNSSMSLKDLPKDLIDNTHQSIAYNTSFLKSQNYVQTEGIPYTDTEWYAFPMSMASSFSYFPGIIYSYNREREDQSMSSNVHIKSLGTNRDIVLKVIKHYEHNKESMSDENKMISFIIARNEAKFLYKCLLIKYGRQVENDFVKSFDINLKSISPEIYSSVETVYDKRKFGTLYYVRQWRKVHSRRSLAFAYYDFGMSIGQFCRHFIRKY